MKASAVDSLASLSSRVDESLDSPQAVSTTIRTTGMCNLCITQSSFGSKGMSLHHKFTGAHAPPEEGLLILLFKRLLDITPDRGIFRCCRRRSSNSSGPPNHRDRGFTNPVSVVSQLGFVVSSGCWGIVVNSSTIPKTIS